MSRFQVTDVHIFVNTVDGDATDKTGLAFSIEGSHGHMATTSAKHMGVTPWRYRNELAS